MSAETMEVRLQPTKEVPTYLPRLGELPLALRGLLYSAGSPTQRVTRECLQDGSDRPFARGRRIGGYSSRGKGTSSFILGEGPP